MYGLIWRILPGPRPVKFLLFLGLTAALAAFLWYVAFPWVDPYMPFNDSTMGSAPQTPAGEAPPPPADGADPALSGP
ncbi:hypothetical protein ACQEU5_03885 [Marinactinospora thermotolerans]|uniref:Uncharacterized protein n=1 Tax=Marinactinospora thermotolerans DSM 45154 TaxID=1122192 RepID=A0A1T4Q6L1_9ACTN|nr:hypothetical protein [Marinactinospora thermotolerans]SJZ99402.1 hypothetical protein SAMN02745673_02069 [Marinactinospora thermotolerans DSM 45154]